MTLFTLNLLLAFAWCLLWQSYGPVEYLTGFVISYGILRFFLGTRPRELYMGRVLVSAGYLARFLYEIVKANVLVAKIVLAPRLRIRPGIIAYKLGVKSEGGITLLANSITLTPGTLSVDVSDDKKTLYVHALDIEDPRKTEQEIRDSLERYSREVLS